MRSSLMRGRLAFAAVLAVAGIVGGALVMAWPGGVEAWSRQDVPGVVAAKDEPHSDPRIAAELMKPGPLPELVLGRPDAPVTIVEYADLTCPHCASFHSKVLPLVREKYIDAGKARLVFREFPLNVHSLVAFMSVRCVAPEAAFPLLADLFSHQEDWIQAKSMKELADKLFARGHPYNLTREAFDNCVPGGDELATDRQKQLFGDISGVRDHAGKAFGVHSTPTFFVNGERLPGGTIEDFDKAIGAALGR